MFTSAKVWTLLISVLVIAPLFGLWGEKVSCGGENGVVNLPSAAMACTSQVAVSGRPLRSSDNRACRLQYEIPSLANGLFLVLPSNMPTAAATYIYGGATLPASLVTETMEIDPAMLKSLQHALVGEFSLVLVSGDGAYLNILIEFSGEGAGCQVYVE